MPSSSSKATSSRCSSSPPARSCGSSARSASSGTDVRAALAAIVGDDHVVDPADWLEDITEHPPGKAELTVAPGTRDEVVAVLRWAAAEGVAVTPVVAGYNVAGIA